MFRAVKSSLLYPQRNRNITTRTPTATLPCKRNPNSSGELQPKPDAAASCLSRRCPRLGSPDASHSGRRRRDQGSV